MKKRTLALDVGDRRIGIAYSDPFGISLNPLPYIENNEKVFEKLANIIKEYDIGTIVVGLPLTLKGEEGEQAKKTKEFVNKLKKHISNDINIEFIDERFTTALAEKHLQQTSKKSKIRKKLDSVSAMYILKIYLDRKNI